MWQLLIILGVVVVCLLVLRRRKLARAEVARVLDFGTVRRVVEEDVTRFGEELQELHIDMLTTTLDTAMRQDYQRALDTYENARSLLSEASTEADLSEVTKTLEDGRYSQACVLARRDGRELPQRRPPCFFNPAHGPAETDVAWAPAGGIEREIPVCLADAERVHAGAEPHSRMVRSGNKMVPWFQGGPRYAPYADGYYGAYALNGLFPAFLIGSMMGGMWSGDIGGDAGGADLSDAGGADLGGGGEADWSSGGDIGGGELGGAGGGDWGGFGGDIGGGGDLGGFGDFGGF